MHHGHPYPILNPIGQGVIYYGIIYMVREKNMDNDKNWTKYMKNDKILTNNTKKPSKKLCIPGRELGIKDY